MAGNEVSCHSDGSPPVSCGRSLNSRYSSAVHLPLEGREGMVVFKEGQQACALHCSKSSCPCRQLKGRRAALLTVPTSLGVRPTR